MWRAMRAMRAFKHLEPWLPTWLRSSQWLQEYQAIPGHTRPYLSYLSQEGSQNVSTVKWYQKSFSNMHMHSLLVAFFKEADPKLDTVRYIQSTPASGIGGTIWFGTCTSGHFFSTCCLRTGEDHSLSVPKLRRLHTIDHFGCSVLLA